MPSKVNDMEALTSDVQERELLSAEERRGVRRDAWVWLRTLFEGFEVDMRFQPEDRAMVDDSQAESSRFVVETFELRGEQENRLAQAMSVA